MKKSDSQQSLTDSRRRALLKEAAGITLGAITFPAVLTACGGGGGNDATISTNGTRTRPTVNGATSSGNFAPPSNGSYNEVAPPSSSNPTRTPVNAKNILVIITDQERNHCHWPEGWAEKNLPSLTRLKKNGLTFTNAYTAACECSPSRAVMMTGQFSTVTGVAVTFNPPGLPTKAKMQSIGTLLQSKSKYYPAWKGKWHLNYPAASSTNDVPSEWAPVDITNMLNNYGWNQWNPADSGTAIPRASTLATLGGGTANNDGRYISGATNVAGGQTAGVTGTTSAVDFINNAKSLNQPFCLFVNLVNPHDVGAYPNVYKQAGYSYEAFANLGIPLPPNYQDDLSKKPSVQAHYAALSRSAFFDNKSSGSIPEQMAKDYVNFYAYLHTVVDKQIETLLSALDNNQLTKDTIIIRMADHGEAGLSHNGMTEKSYTAYQEMINVPLVVSNPEIFPQPITTNAFYDHQDLLPTILDLAGVNNPNSYGNGIGRSIVPLFKNPQSTVRDCAMFTYDDVFSLSPNITGGHIRAIRYDRWLYATYFTASATSPDLEYELYDLSQDPYQLNNLLATQPSNSNLIQTWNMLHSKLTTNFRTVNHLDAGLSFKWPDTPTPITKKTTA